MICPHCSGEGFQYVGFPVVRIGCTLCDGAGTMDDGFPEREAHGQRVRDGRLRLGFSLRHFSEEFQIDVVRLSALERGKVADEELDKRLKAVFQVLESRGEQKGKER